VYGILVRKEGEPAELFAEFHRHDDKVTLGETDTVKGGQNYIFAPVYEAWGRAIPSDWKNQQPARSLSFPLRPAAIFLMPTGADGAGLI
jgi:hypothetical protein